MGIRTPWGPHVGSRGRSNLGPFVGFAPYRRLCAYFWILFLNFKPVTNLIERVCVESQLVFFYLTPTPFALLLQACSHAVTFDLFCDLLVRLSHSSPRNLCFEKCYGWLWKNFVWLTIANGASSQRPSDFSGHSCICRLCFYEK